MAHQIELDDILGKYNSTLLASSYTEGKKLTIDTHINDVGKITAFFAIYKADKRHSSGYRIHNRHTISSDAVNDYNSL